MYLEFNRASEDTDNDGDQCRKGLHWISEQTRVSLMDGELKSVSGAGRSVWQS